MIQKLVSALLLFTAVSVTAQRNTYSTYSMYGLGLDSAPKTSIYEAMGGIGIANQEYNYLNFANPAAIANLRVATYGIGGVSNFLQISSDHKNGEAFKSTSLNYISLGFPIGERAGVSVGLQPRTAVGYKLVTNGKVSQDNSTTTRFGGNGGTDKLYANFGIKLLEKVSLGVEGGYIFGNIKRDIISGKSDASTATKYIGRSTVTGKQLRFGVQYKTNLPNDLQLSTGISYKLAESLNLVNEEAMFSFTYDGRGLETVKKALFNRKKNETVTIGQSLDLGVGIGQNDKWYIGLNTKVRRSYDNSQATGQTSLGGYYIPKKNSISSYFKRITYRSGINYKKDFVIQNSTNIANQFTAYNDFGINLGLGLPLPKQLSSLNIGLTYGVKKGDENKLVDENYIKVNLGLSLNSLNWFKKRKID